MKKFLGIIESPTPPPTQYVWLYEGEAKYFSNGKWISLKDKVNEEKEEGSAVDSKYDTSKLLPYVDLEIGNSAEVKALNIEKLQLGHFFVTIDSGCGVGSWNPTTGGHAHIVTAFGNTVYYNISPEGSVAKETESPDLYYEYLNKGGKKTPSEFIEELLNLIG